MPVVQKGTTITDLQFNTNSKLVVFSADDSTTGIVKPADNKVDQIFSDHDRNYSCNSISINSNDNLVASGSADGHLVVRSLRDGEVVMTDRQIRSPITKCRFSPTSQRTLATSFESGVVALWDLQSKVLKQKFLAHSASCTGIAFSPVNNLLMCSVGLDEKIHFFDIVECKEVKQIMTGLQLSCISFCSDGHTIAVGSEQGGKALVYDLKTPKTVKLDLKGHEKSKRVSCIQFTRLYTPSS